MTLTLAPRPPSRMKFASRLICSRLRDSLGGLVGIESFPFKFEAIIFAATGKAPAVSVPEDPFGSGVPFEETAAEIALGFTDVPIEATGFSHIKTLAHTKSSPHKI